MRVLDRLRSLGPWALLGVVGLIALAATMFALRDGGALLALSGPEVTPGPAMPTAVAGTTAAAGAPTPVAEAKPAEQSRMVVTLGSDTIKQYGHLTLSADGFAQNEDVLVAALPEGDGQPIELGRAHADGNGHVADFAADLPEPVKSGVRPITVTGLTSHRQATAKLNVRADKLFAVLNSYTPRPADKLGFVVGGFEPNSDVQVFLGDTSSKPIAVVRADPAGNTAWTEVTVPVVKPGEYALVFQGANSTDQYTQRITVNGLSPTLELSPWSGPPGSTLELNGRGFLAGESVSVYLGTTDKAASTFRADQYGNFWGIGPLVVPTDAGGGKLTIRLVGEQSGAEITQSFAVVGVKPWAELSAYSGMPGTTVSFSGGGFAAKESVSIHLGNASGPVVATAETDDFGQVIRSTATAATPVEGDTPATTPTNVTFTIVGESSKGEASAVFTVIPIIRPSLGGETPRTP
jgi:hypothetical protein